MSSRTCTSNSCQVTIDPSRRLRNVNVHGRQSQGCSACELVNVNTGSQMTYEHENATQGCFGGSARTGCEDSPAGRTTAIKKVAGRTWCHQVPPSWHVRLDCVMEHGGVAVRDEPCSVPMLRLLGHVRQTRG
jgi:hypothetical protein